MTIHLSHLDTWIERILFGIALTSCALPVFVVKGLFQPFLTPRELLLRVLALAAVPALIVYWGRRNSFRLGWVSAAVLAVLGAGLLATIFSHNPTVSFWGNADRLTGWVTFLEFAVVGVVFYTVSLQPARRNILLGAWAAVWVVVALWGIAERIIPGFWAQFNGGGGRSAGTFGNSIFLANSVLAAVAGLLPVTLSFRHPRWRAAATMLLVLVGGWCILNTETRGAYVGVGAGILVSLVVLGWWSRQRLVRVVAIGIPLALCLAVFGLWVFRATPAVATIASIHPFIGRAVSVFNGRDPSQLQRFELWRIATRAIQDRPLFGWGLEQFDTALDRNYDPHFTIYDVSNSYADRVHNTFLDVTVAGGFVGLAAYLFFFFVLGRQVVRARQMGALRLLAAAAALGGIAAYLAMLLTAFETPGTMLSLAFGLAVLSAVIRPEPSRTPVHVVPERWWYALAGVCTLAGIWVIGAAVVPVVRAAHVVHVAVTTSSGDALLAAAEEGAKMTQPYRPQYELRVANEIFKAVGTGDGTGRAVPREALLRRAEALLKDARVGLPNHFGAQLMLGNVLLLQAAYGLTGVDVAIAEIEKARTMAPQRQVTYFQLGNAYLVVGDPERAHQEFETALVMDPSIPESAWHAARGRAAVGDVAGAAPLFQQAWQGGFGDNRPDPELVVAINTLIAVGDLGLVQKMYAEWVQRPDAPAGRWASLAVVAATNADVPAAIRALKRAIQLDPTLAEEVPAFLAEFGLPADALSAPETDS